jgi:hypothetical protein
MTCEIASRLARPFPSTQPSTKPDPIETHAKALQAIEVSKGFSQEDLADAALVIENNPTFAHMYLSMENVNACRTYLLCHMARVKNYN